MKKEKIGFISKLSGINGELIFFSKVSSPEFKNDDLIFLELDGEAVPFYIEQFKGLNSEKYLLKLENVDSSKKAERLIHATVLKSTENFTDENVNISLVGFKVMDIHKGNCGVVTYLDENPKNPLLIISLEEKEGMIPFNDNFILSINEKEKIIEVDLPEGLLEIYFND